MNDLRNCIKVKKEKGGFRLFCKKQFQFYETFKVGEKEKVVSRLIVQGEQGGFFDNDSDAENSWIENGCNVTDSIVKNSFISCLSYLNSTRIHDSVINATRIERNSVVRDSFVENATVECGVSVLGSIVRGKEIKRKVEDSFVGLEQSVLFESIKDCDLTTDFSQSLRTQLNTDFVDGVVLLFKRVTFDGRSFHHESFKYPKKGWVEEKNFDSNVNMSCSSGLHFSHPRFWNDKPGKTISALIRKEDIICILSDKVRCKKAYIFPSFDLPPEPKRIRRRK